MTLNRAQLPLRRLATCLDHLRVPLNAEERYCRPGNVPYWGANTIQGYVDDALISEPVVLLGEDGAPFFDRNRPVAFYSTEPIWPNNHIHVLRPKSAINGRWLTYAFNDVDYSLYIDGSTRDKLTQGSMMSIVLSVPGSRAQTAIADYLDRETAQIDALIEKQEQLIVTLRERRDAIRDRVVHQALPWKPGARFKHYVCEVNQGWSPQCLNWPADGVDDWAVLKTGCTNWGIFRPTENKALPPDESPQPDTVVKKGQIVVSRANTRELVGSAALVHDDFPRLMLSDKLYAFTVTRDAVPEYVLQVLNTRKVRDLIGMEASGSSPSMQNVSQADLLNIPMPLPSMSSQREAVAAIVHATGRIDRLVSESLRFIELAKERRAALITAAVTGQIDVRSAA